MPTTLSPTDIANIALLRVGAQAINSLLDPTNPSAVACNNCWQLAYLEVSRSSKWNCLLTPAILVQQAQTPIPGLSTGSSTITATAWAPLTFYAANSFLSYGGYYYQVMYDYTSTKNFVNDLTTGALTQQDQQIGSSVTDAFSSVGLGSIYPSGWAYQYALPSDFQLLCILNDNQYWDFDGSGGSDQYEIMGTSLFTNASRAIIKYVKSQPDTTQFDSLFTSALTFLLASMICNTLRQDGGRGQQEFQMMYQQALTTARIKNAGERQMIRFNPITSSNFNAARFGGTNG